MRVGNKSANFGMISVAKKKQRGPGSRRIRDGELSLLHARTCSIDDFSATVPQCCLGLHGYAVRADENSISGPGSIDTLQADNAPGFIGGKNLGIVNDGAARTDPAGSAAPRSIGFYGHLQFVQRQAHSHAEPGRAGAFNIHLLCPPVQYSSLYRERCPLRQRPWRCAGGSHPESDQVRQNFRRRRVSA